MITVHLSFIAEKCHNAMRQGIRSSLKDKIRETLTILQYGYADFTSIGLTLKLEVENIINT
jgi:hypothetical protein